MAIEQLLQRVKKTGLGIVVASSLGFLIYESYCSNDLVKQEQAMLMAKNPVLIRHERSTSIYGFNTDNDPEIDLLVIAKIVYGPGPRSGMPKYFQREITEEKDAEFHQELDKYR